MGVKIVAALSLTLLACGGPPKNMGGQGYTLTFTPVTIAPGAERTQCVTKKIGNTTPIHVGAFHNVLGAGSHHLIVYRVSDTVEQPDPVDCEPFRDTLDPTSGAPLVITQKQEDQLTLPPGVAYTLAAHQMLRLEIHYINASQQPLTLNASVNLVTIADEAFRDEADLLFIGNPDISIPAMGQLTLGPTFFPVPARYASANFFAITGHEHRFGTNVTVSLASDKSDVGKAIYDVPGWSWSEPATVQHDPPFKVVAGGGFQFSCSWNNTSMSPVKFGESATAEMCFFWAYYYPSQGPQVCFHSDRFGGGIDVCCPESPLCSLINGLH